MIDALNAGDAGDAALLSAAFGWPHRTTDWAFFLRLGRGLAWRADGRLCGTALWFPLDQAHAAIGLVQVAPDLQGQGIGKHLMRALMADAAPRRLLLHATAAGAGLYEALGFAPGGIVQQWQGTCTGPSAPSPARPAIATDRAGILRLDASATGLAREPILDACMQGATTVVTGPPNNLTGYAIRRQFGHGNLIGPVVAVDEPTAIATVEALSEPGFLRLDVPIKATTLINALAKRGLTHAGDVQAMTTGTWPNQDKQYALAAQALG